MRPSQVYFEAQSLIKKQHAQLDADASITHTDASITHTDASITHTDASITHTDASITHTDASITHTDASYAYGCPSITPLSRVASKSIPRNIKERTLKIEPNAINA